ncbi:hypothetical protein GO495_01200 [Chitinophaga oryziterrae]|uniref:YD repeat-containing protein n=1 Tax=Chitinophaga oryziterrae TaxID=1031224 RepID=A0A6N8J1U0_9BACT|nr:hypothetical protein [Chitinophaga oryziterrae]MVT39185.1 hypothetical protein [Chitinophaga oryziterrae]
MGRIRLDIKCRRSNNPFSIQGIPDDGNGGFLVNPNLPLPECTSSLGSGDAAYDYFEAVTRQSNDTESDMYYFNFCGKSGKFVFDKSGNVHTIPYQKIKIKKNPSNPSATGLTEWEITTEDGTIFYFNVTETMQTVTNTFGSDQGASATSYIGSWYLKEIRSPRTNQKISFEYTSDRYEYEMPSSETKYDWDPASPLGCVLHGSYSINKTIIQDAKKISKIIFPTGSVEFVAGKYRHDLQGSQVLDKIVIKNTLDTIKSYTLLYNYFSTSMVEFASLPDAGSNTVANTSYRLSLKGIQELSANSLVGQSYEFTYENSIYLPNRVTSKAVDHWGYYNGQTGNTTLIPSYTSNTGTYVVGAFRQTVEPYAQAGVLKKIKYPTGGSTLFEYESNETNNPFYWDDVQKANYIGGGGMCHITPGQVFELLYPTTFKLSFTGTKWPVAVSGSCTNQPFNPSQPSTYVYFNVFKVNDPANPVNMDVLGNGSVGPITIGYASANYTTTIVLPAGKYQIQARVGSASGPLIQSGVNVDGMYTFGLEGDIITRKGTKKVGGLRVAQMTDYDPVSDKGIIKVYKYNIDDTTSSGIINYIPTYKYQFREAQLCTNASGGTDVFVPEYTVYSSSSYAPLTSLQGGNVGYDKVIVYYGKDGNGNIGTNGKSEYYYNSRTDFSFLPSRITLNQPQNVCYNPGRIGQTSLFPFATPVSVDWARGYVLQEINYKNVNNSFVKVDETFNTYKDDFQGIWDTYNPLFDVLGAKVDWALRVPTQAQLTPKPVLIVQYYFVPSRYVKLTKAEKRTYDVSGSTYLSLVNEYQYNDINSDLQLKTETFLDSKGDAVKTEYKYPGDYPSIPVYGSMKTNNILDAVIEKNIYHKDVITKGIKNNYIQLSNLFVPESSELKIGNLSASKFYFSRYDSYGNLLEQQKSDDIFSSYIYDYTGVHLISETRNARYNDIAYTSFESDGKGNWEFSGVPVQDDTSPTGNKCYNLSSGNLSRSGLTTTMTYKVSYWTKNSVPFNITGTQNGYPVKSETINGWTYYEHNITGQSVISISGTGLIDEARAYPENAQMTTYTWNPLIGLTHQCDAKSQITYYEYDDFGRLKLIRDQNRMILKQYDYQYQKPITQ